MRRGRGWGLLVLSSIVMLGKPSDATTVAPESRETLLAKAPVIVHGKIVQMEVHPTTGRRTAILEAFEVVKGSEAHKRQRDFHVPLLNRAIPHRDLVQVVPSAPEMKLGDELVVFLRPAAGPVGPGGAELFVLEGFHQGKYRVVADAQGVRKVAAWDDLPEKPLNPAELQAQKTSVRLKRGRSRGLVEKSAVVDKLETLDSLLSSARSAGGGT